MIKGNIAIDLFVAMFLIIGIVFGVFIAATIYLNVFPLIEADDSIKNNSYTVSAQTGIDAIALMIPLMIIGTFVGIIILNFFVSSHPAFAVVSILLLLILTVISAGISNVLEAFTTSPVISATSARYPIVAQVTGILPLIVFVFGSLAIIVLYGKKRQEGEF